MKRWQVEPGKGLEQIEVDRPEPGPGRVRVRVRAASLNYRDHLQLSGQYAGGDTAPIVPLSDGAGEVSALGPGVGRVRVGDRVTAATIGSWVDGAYDPLPGDSIGFSRDGWLQEEIVLPETSLAKLPDSISFEAAATFPCAGVTAWNAVIETGRAGPGDSVLVLGTGGVSMFAVQLARMAGARAIITSSSDAKLERARKLGADEGINYVTTPDWHERARELTAGRGVDVVVENAGLLGQSCRAARRGGTVALIGVLAFFAGDPAAENLNVREIFVSGAIVSPIMMGPRRMLERMLGAYDRHGLEPVIDTVFAFDDAKSAYAALAAAGHMGKLVVSC
jgi:NADPH:quinone reductase-like Zn-dependent oxidoreductase